MELFEVTVDQVGIFTNTLISGFAFGMALLFLLPDSKTPGIPDWAWYVIRYSFITIFLCESARHGYLAVREVYDFPTPSQSHPIAIVSNLIMILAYPPVLVIGAWIKWRLRAQHRGS